MHAKELLLLLIFFQWQKGQKCVAHTTHTFHVSPTPPFIGDFPPRIVIYVRSLEERQRRLSLGFVGKMPSIAPSHGCLCFCRPVCQHKF